MQTALTDFDFTIYYITYRFHSESTLYSWLECQESPCSKQAPYLNLSGSNRIQTYNHLARKQTLTSHLAKLALIQFKSHGSGRKHGE